jgi:hypothetical protein
VSGKKSTVANKLSLLYAWAALAHARRVIQELTGSMVALARSKRMLIDAALVHMTRIT